MSHIANNIAERNTIDTCYHRVTTIMHIMQMFTRAKAKEENFAYWQFHNAIV